MEKTATPTGKDSEDLSSEEVTQLLAAIGVGSDSDSEESDDLRMRVRIMDFCRPEVHSRQVHSRQDLAKAYAYASKAIVPQLWDAMLSMAKERNPKVGPARVQSLRLCSVDQLYLGEFLRSQENPGYVYRVEHFGYSPYFMSIKSNFPSMLTGNKGVQSDAELRVVRLFKRSVIRSFRKTFLKGDLPLASPRRAVWITDSYAYDRRFSQESNSIHGVLFTNNQARKALGL